MNEAEQKLADEIYEAIQYASNYSVRSLQSRDFRMGVSDLGYCSERAKRMLDQQVPEDSDALQAFIGTAIGDHVEAACKAKWPHAVTQAEVTLKLVGDGGTYHLSGHPDLIDPAEGLVIDFKSTRGLGVVRRTGPSLSQQYQRHGYALAAWEANYFTCALEDVRVANVWVDRAGDEKELHVQMEKFDPEIVEDAARWLDEVVYAYINKTDARKEPPREVCAVTCGFYDTCRALDTDVEGLLTDATVLAAVDMHTEAMALEKQARKLKDQAKGNLLGVVGSTGEYAVRWVHVNGSVIPEQHRRPYEKLDIRKIK